MKKIGNMHLQIIIVQIFKDLSNCELDISHIQEICNIIKKKQYQTQKITVNLFGNSLSTIGPFLDLYEYSKNNFFLMVFTQLHQIFWLEKCFETLSLLLFFL